MVGEMEPGRHLRLHQATDQWMAPGQRVLHDGIGTIEKILRVLPGPQEKDLAPRGPLPRSGERFGCRRDEGGIIGARESRPVPANGARATQQRDDREGGDCRSRHRRAANSTRTDPAPGALRDRAQDDEEPGEREVVVAIADQPVEHRRVAGASGEVIGKDPRGLDDRRLHERGKQHQDQADREGARQRTVEGPAPGREQRRQQEDHEGAQPCEHRECAPGLRDDEVGKIARPFERALRDRRQQASREEHRLRAGPEHERPKRQDGERGGDESRREAQSRLGRGPLRIRPREQQHADRRKNEARLLGKHRSECRNARAHRPCHRTLRSKALHTDERRQPEEGRKQVEAVREPRRGGKRGRMRRERDGRCSGDHGGDRQASGEEEEHCRAAQVQGHVRQVVRAVVVAEESDRHPPEEGAHRPEKEQAERILHQQEQRRFDLPRHRDEGEVVRIGARGAQGVEEQRGKGGAGDGVERRSAHQSFVRWRIPRGRLRMTAMIHLQNQGV